MQGIVTVNKSAKIKKQRFLCAELYPAPLQLKRKPFWMEFIFHSLDITAKDEDGNQPVIPTTNV